MFYSVYLFTETLLTAAFLYCVLFVSPGTLTNLFAATALSLAVLSCLLGVGQLWSNVWRSYLRVQPSRAVRETASSNLRGTRDVLGGTMLGQFAKTLVTCALCVCGHFGIIVALTWAPLQGYPYAQSLASVPVIAYSTNSVVHKTASLINFSWTRGCALVELLKPYLTFEQHAERAAFRKLANGWASITGEQRPVARVAAQVVSTIELFKETVDPLWNIPQFRSIWIVLWCGCAVLVVVLYQTCIGKKSLAHITALLIGALTAGLLNENSLLKDIQGVVNLRPVSPSQGVRPVDVVVQRLGMLELACRCVNRALAFLSITTWIAIAFIILALPSSARLRTQKSADTPVVKTQTFATITATKRSRIHQRQSQAEQTFALPGEVDSLHHHQHHH